jgi:nicotinamide phosphoribosyltransferase
MNIHTIRSLCRAITDAGWSLDNIACFGMGGKLLQSVDRDTLKFAFKCSAIFYDGIWHEVFKDPVGDHGKVSKKGIHAVIYNNGNKKYFQTVSAIRSPFETVFGDHLALVFENGTIVRNYGFSEIRERAKASYYGKRIVGAVYSREE